MRGAARLEATRRIRAALDSAYQAADDRFHAGLFDADGLSASLLAALDELSENGAAASTAFTGIVTCLAVKIAYPQIDVRYHQRQIQNRTSRPAGFNFRGFSEKLVFPWLSAPEHRFEGAKSGWQTRTIERPKPYTLDYDENIDIVKDSFLLVFDRIEEAGEPADAALRRLFLQQIVKRETRRITLATPSPVSIAAAIDLFHRHFHRRYSGGKGASRLPVLAIHALYKLLVRETARYAGKSLLPLQAHSAADARTGATGDVEVIDDATGDVVEAWEIKHKLPIDQKVALDIHAKVMNRRVRRYYVLTTHDRVAPNGEAAAVFDTMWAMHQCEVICDGVLPFLDRALRLVEDPTAIFGPYVKLLDADAALGHQHRAGWNAVVAGAAD